MAIPRDHHLSEVEVYQTQLLMRSSLLNLLEVQKLRGEVLTEGGIVSLVRKVIKMNCQVMGIDEREFRKEYPSVARELTVFAQEKEFYVKSTDGEVIYDKKRKEEYERWTMGSQIARHRWDAYRQYLLSKKEKPLPLNILDTLDKDSDKILSFFPLPDKNSSFYVYGLVMGFVQSGKSMNFCAVINKVLDIGYDIIIILGGIPSNLRNQTQERVEEDVVGYRTDTGEFFGIGNLLNREKDVEIYTSRDDGSISGDFGTGRLKSLTSYHGEKKLVFVIKKNVYMLRALLKWLEKQPICKEINQCNGEQKKTVKRIKNLSLLMIDDEVDNGGLNINKSNSKTKESCKEKGGKRSNNAANSPSAINGEIRKILAIFEKKVYVGYTATPFANIFVDPYCNLSEEHGPDLFPKDFIYLLQPPSNYLGPFEFFGMDYDGRNIDPLPLFRITNDLDNGVEDWDYKNGISPSLKDAINSFILSGAIRRLRGEKHEHHSMLVNVSHLVDDHEAIAECISNYLKEVKTIVSGNSGNNSVFNMMEELWQKDFLLKTEQVRAIEGKRNPKNVERYISNYPFSDIEQEIRNFMKELIGVKIINGTSEDELNYGKHKEEYGTGLKVICVGSLSLNRGYTLDGLCISYYTHLSLQLDTVLQSGRWYGYRDSYKDLIRVYTTKRNQTVLSQAANVTYKLISQLKKMAREGKTPAEFGLYLEKIKEGVVRKSKTGKERTERIRPTAKKRMGKYYEVDDSLSGNSLDVAAFPIEESIIEENHKITATFLESLGKPKDKTEIHWENVPTDLVLAFIKEFKIGKFSRFNGKELFKRYIEIVRTLPNKEYRQLEYFDVVLVNPDKVKRDEKYSLGSYKVNMGQPKGKYHESDNYFDIADGRAISPRQLERFLPMETRKELYKDPRVKADKIIPVDMIKEQLKEQKKGLLLISLYDPNHINEGESMIKHGIKVEKPPIGLHIALPECDVYPSRKSVVNVVYYLNEVIGGELV